MDEHRHFGRAAESCQVSQPALSNGIRELERELGVTIIKRTRAFEGITPEGERVIRWVRQVLSSLEGLRHEADLVRSVLRGHLAIGVIPTASYAATLLSADYREMLPQLTLEVLSLSTPEILRCLKSQDIHLGMLYDKSVVGDAYDLLPLFAERYVLIAGEHASLPREAGLAEVADLRPYLEKLGHELIVTSDKHGVNAAFEKHLPDAEVVISQPFWPAYLTKERIAKAKKLKLALTAGNGVGSCRSGSGGACQRDRGRGDRIKQHQRGGTRHDDAAIIGSQRAALARHRRERSVERGRLRGTQL